jgi:hypothetical protein
MPEQTISPLRQRMIEDMTVRNFAEKTRNDYIRHVKMFTATHPTRRRPRTFGAFRYTRHRSAYAHRASTARWRRCGFSMV